MVTAWTPHAYRMTVMWIAAQAMAWSMARDISRDRDSRRDEAGNGTGDEGPCGISAVQPYRPGTCHRVTASGRLFSRGYVSISVSPAVARCRLSRPDSFYHRLFQTRAFGASARHGGPRWTVSPSTHSYMAPWTKQSHYPQYSFPIRVPCTLLSPLNTEI